MRKSGWIGLALIVLGAVAAAGAAAEEEQSSSGSPPSESGSSSKESSSSDTGPRVNCRAPNAPYYDYKCLDPYLGTGFLERLINYYRLEWGHSQAPADPDEPKPRRTGWPHAGLKVPPNPFTDWPYGAGTAIGISRPNAIDSPFMIALSNTALGQMLRASHIQIWGWAAVGGNISTNTVRPGGNWPAGYDYTPNRDQLDQAVMFIERVPDTVQKDHIDWGFRMAGLYGGNYRYTSALGLASGQLHGFDSIEGYDFPQFYAEVYLPQFAEGLVVRVGRYTALPDLETPFAPSNYLYSHSLSHIYDGYTNTGALASLAFNRNWILQFGLNVGTDTMPWNIGSKVPNPFPNPVFPDTTMPRDPGARLSWSAAARWQSDSAWDAVYIVANGINGGVWGYDNAQWTGLTWFHRLAPDWHLAWEAYALEQKNVLNIADPLGIIANGGYPFTPANGFNFNSPFFAQCSDPKAITCTARAIGTVAYLNHQFSPLDNMTFRAEFYDDMQGQRTGTKTRYIDFALGWQHWFSPQVEIRPEMAYYRSLGPPAFNGNFNARPDPIPPSRRDAVIVAADLIWHF